MKTSNNGLRLLRIIRSATGMNAGEMIGQTMIERSDIRDMRSLETAGLIEYRDSGWWLTGAGDLLLAENQ